MGGTCRSLASDRGATVYAAKVRNFVLDARGGSAPSRGRVCGHMMREKNRRRRSRPPSKYGARRRIGVKKRAMKSAAKPRKTAPPRETAPPVPPDAARTAALYEDTAHLQPFYHLTMWLPDAERETLVRQILTVARSNLIMGSEERAAALMSVAPCLPETERAAILREVLETATSPDPFLRGVLDKYESKALVENREKPPYKPDMEQSPDIGDATLKQAESQLVDAIGKLGFDAAAKVFARIAPPDERARLESMAARGREAAPKLSAADLAAFMAHAASHQWNPESKPKVAPSAFIKETFKKWLGRGLALTDVKAAQENLAGAYSTEVSREPSKRVKGLYVRPHKLAAGRPRQVVVVRRVGHVADLPEEEAAKIRAKGAARTAKWRAAKAAPQLAAR